MYTRNHLENILFLDIETVSTTATYEELSERIQALWDKKAHLINKREETPLPPEDLYREKAAIFSEFGKVVCISVGYLKFVEGRATFKLKSYYGADEDQLLKDFAAMLNQFMAKPNRNLCAHNGKEFDFPYLGRRYLIRGIEMPSAIAAIQTAKPWEVRMIDTMVLWKFGDYKNFTSLDLLCAIMDVPTPKDDIDGSAVGRVFWEENDAERIAKYCEKDVLATAQVLLRMSREELVKDEDVVWGV